MVPEAFERLRKRTLNLVAGTHQGKRSHLPSAM
jgi:hypothetical protein